VRGFTHGLSAGAAFACADEYVFHQRPAFVLAGTAVAIGAGVLSDADTRGSCVARSFGWVTEAMAWVVHRISGGHREWTHTAVGDGICALLAVLAISLEGEHFRLHAGPLSRELSAGRVMLGVYLAILLGAGMKALRILHRGELGREALATGLAVAMAWSGFDQGGVAWAILLGTVVHALGDGLTEHGEAYFRPLTDHVFHLLPKPLRLSTGHFTERFIIAPAMIAALAFLAYHAVSIPAHTLIAERIGR